MSTITITVTPPPAIEITVNESGVAADRANASAAEAAAIVDGFDVHVDGKKTELDNYVDDPLKISLDTYTTTKEGEIDTYVSGKITSDIDPEVAKAATWAEGDDAAVIELGGEKSSKRWAIQAQAVYDNDIEPNLLNINKVADNEANITKVADNEINVNKVAVIDADVTAVAAIDTDVTKVADIDAEVVIVADNIIPVQTVSTNIADVNFVATAELEEVEPTATQEVEDAFFGRAAGEVREGNDLKFGDVTGGNYTEIEADGTIKFHGDATVFHDEMHSLIHQIKGNPSDKLVDNVAEGSITYKDNATTANYVMMTVQLNHGRKNGADVYPHLHWWQTTENMPNWLIQYRWQRNGEAKVTDWTDLPYDTNAFTYTTGTLNQITRFGAVTPPTGDDVSDLFQIRLIRDVANTSTEFADAETSPVDQDAVSLDVHIEIDTIGSREEYIK